MNEKLCFIASVSNKEDKLLSVLEKNIMFKYSVYYIKNKVPEDLFRIYIFFKVLYRSTSEVMVHSAPCIKSVPYFTFWNFFSKCIIFSKCIATEAVHWVLSTIEHQSIQSFFGKYLYISSFWDSLWIFCWFTKPIGCLKSFSAYCLPFKTRRCGIKCNWTSYKYHAVNNVLSNPM